MLQCEITAPALDEDRYDSIDKEEMEEGVAMRKWDTPDSPSCVSKGPLIMNSRSAARQIVLLEQSSASLPSLRITELMKVYCHPMPPLLSALRTTGKFSPSCSCQQIRTLSPALRATERRVRGLWNPSCNCLFSRLHDDMLLEIMSHLTMKDIISSSMVCRRWRHCASHSHSWKQVDATDYITSGKTPSVTSRTLTKHLVRHESQIVSLRILDIQHSLISNIALPSLCFLRELAISGYADLTDTHVHVMMLSSRMKSRLKHHKVTLQILKLEQCPLLTNACLKSIALNCSELQQLSLRGNQSITCLTPLCRLFSYKRHIVEEKCVPFFGSSSAFFNVTETDKSDALLSHSRKMDECTSKDNALGSLFCASPPSARSRLPSRSFPVAEQKNTLRQGKRGLLKSIDVSHTGVTASAFLEALRQEMGGASSTSTRANSLVQIECIKMNGSGETWTNEILEKLAHAVDISKLEILDIGCASKHQDSTQVTDVGLQSLLNARPNALQFLIISGHAAISSKFVTNCKLLSTSPKLI